MNESKPPADRQSYQPMRRSPLAFFYYALASLLMTVGLLLTLADPDLITGIPIIALGLPFVFFTFQQERRDERKAADRYRQN